MLRHDEFRTPIVSALSHFEHVEASFILTSRRVHERVSPRGRQGWVHSHLRTTSHLPCHQLVLSYARTSLFVLFHYVYFALLYVLVSPCFTVMKVSCEFGLSKYRKANSKVLTNRKYGVATVWYVSSIAHSGPFQFILCRLVATLGSKSSLKRITRKQMLDVDVAKACKTIVDPAAPMALRLQGNLL